MANCQENIYHFVMVVYKVQCKAIFKFWWKIQMKSCYMRKTKTLVIYRVCITKKPRDIYDKFLNKEKCILRLFECFQLSESTGCCQKRRWDRIVALCVLLKKRLSYLYRCKDVLQWFGRNSSSFHAGTQFYLSTSPSHTRNKEFTFFTTAIFKGIGAPLYNCLGYVGGTIACICIPVLNEKVV